MFMQISIGPALSFAYFLKDLELLNFQKLTFWNRQLTWQALSSFSH